MAIPSSYTSGAGPQIDRLDVGQLGPPLLNDYYGSSIQRRDVMAVAEEIRRRHLAKLPTDTGLLKSTARVTATRSKDHPDGRWVAEYSVGGARAPYIVPLEDEHHYLDSVLSEMGFYVGDNVSGPTGKIAPADREPPRSNRATDINNASVNERDAARYRNIESRYLQRLADDRVEGTHPSEVATARHVLAEREAGIRAGEHTSVDDGDRPGQRSEGELRAEVERKLASWGYGGNLKPDKERREMARYEALAEDEATRLDQIDAISALRGARIGTKASEGKFQAANFQRVAAMLNQWDDEGTAEAMEEHNRAREAAGLDPIGVKWNIGEDERPYR